MAGPCTRVPKLSFHLLRKGLGGKIATSISSSSVVCAVSDSFLSHKQAEPFSDAVWPTLNTDTVFLTE